MDLKCVSLWSERNVCSSCETALYVGGNILFCASVREFSLVKLDCIWQGFSRVSVCSDGLRTCAEGMGVAYMNLSMSLGSPACLLSSNAMTM